MNRAEAQAHSQALLQKWRAKHPDARWDDGPAKAAPAQGVAVPAAAATNTRRQQQQTYGNFRPREQQIWADSVAATLAEGHAVFHSAEKLGGTIGVSCDMCHPDAANTHPETYPKYQVQLGRVALLRDMINWCLQNPLRAQPMDDGDPRLKAMEAYIYAQRQGVPLTYGKH